MSYCDRHGVRWTGTRAEHCESCGETFSGTTAGDMHRTGDHAISHGPNRRRCLTADEMLAKGMTFITNSHGTWIWGTGRGQGQAFWLAQDGPGLRTEAPEGNHPQAGVASLHEMEAS